MSDPGYYFFPGDYKRDTAHLSILEDGVYRRLLDHYYSRKEALPQEYPKLYRIVGAHDRDEQEAVRSVVEEFFPINGDGRRHNKRADEEIGRRSAYIAKQSELAHRRWDKDRNPPAEKRRKSKMPRHKPRHKPRQVPSVMLPYPLPYPSPLQIKDKEGMTAFAPYVALTQSEHETLKSKYGSAALVWMIEKLDAHKAAKGVVYKSDAAAIRSWVVEAWQDHQRKNQPRGAAIEDGLQPLTHNCPKCKGRVAAPDPRTRECACGNCAIRWKAE